MLEPDILEDTKSYFPDLYVHLINLERDALKLARLGHNLSSSLLFEMECIGKSVEKLITFSKAGIEDQNTKSSHATLVDRALALRHTLHEMITQHTQALVDDVSLLPLRDIAQSNLPQAPLHDGLTSLAASFPQSSTCISPIIHDLGFGDLGGDMGSIEGEVLCISVAEPMNKNEAGRLDTLILPKGESLYMTRGDAIRIRHHGVSRQNESPLDHFTKTPLTLLVEAKNNVRLQGPLTFSLEKKHVVSDAQKTFESYKAYTAGLSRGKRNYLKNPENEISFMLSLIKGLVGVLCAIIGSAYLDPNNFNPIAALGIFLLTSGLFFSNDIIKTARHRNYFKNFFKKDQTMKQYLEKFNAIRNFYYGENIKRLPTPWTLNFIQEIETKISHENGLATFPLRRVVIDANHGPRIIEQRLAIPHHQVHKSTLNQLSSKDAA